MFITTMPPTKRETEATAADNLPGEPASHDADEDDDDEAFEAHAAHAFRCEGQGSEILP